MKFKVIKVDGAYKYFIKQKGSRNYIPCGWSVLTQYSEKLIILSQTENETIYKVK